MNIYQVIGRNIEVTDAMRSYAEEKLEKLDRFSDQIVDAKVIMSYADDGDAVNPARVEVQVNVPNGIVRAEGERARHLRRCGFSGGQARAPAQNASKAVCSPAATRKPPPPPSRCLTFSPSKKTFFSPKSFAPSATSCAP